MKPLRALLIDDDALNNASLQFMLEHDCAQVDVLACVQSAEDARQFLANTPIQPDVVFLDIHMPGESGFEWLQSLPQRNFDVVFVTAFDDYVLQAIKVSAADYLIKPVSIEELQKAVEKITVRKQQAYSSGHEILENLLHNITPSQPTKIALPHISGIKFVSLDEITHLEADSNYTIVHLQNMQKIVVSKSLKEFEEILPSREFMRVHKSAMIHFQYVKEYSGAHGGEIILHDGNSVAISKKYYDQFIEAMKHVSLTFKRYG